jgi:hypothetical protein
MQRSGIELGAGGQKVAWIEVAFGERVCLEVLERQGEQEGDANALAEHEAQVFDGEVAKGFAAKPVSGGYEVRTVGGLAPSIALKIFERLREIDHVDPAV